MTVEIVELGTSADTGAKERLRFRRHPALIALVPVSLAAVIYAAAASSPGDQTRWAVAVVGALVFFFSFEALGSRLSRKDFDAGLWLAGSWLTLVAFAATFANVIPFSEARDTALAITEPSRKRPDLFSKHPLGTDSQGLDVLGGLAFGARVSLQVSLLAVAVGLIVGGLMGVAAGYFRGWVDTLTTFVVDSVLAFPPLILLLALVTGLEANPLNIGLALAVIGIPTMARLARANTLTFAQREFVLAAKAMGATDRRIIMRELVPNVVRPLLSYSFLIVAILIVAEASLSFLSVGIQRPTPTWGNMIAAQVENFQRVPHLVFLPSAAIFLTVFSINRVGDRVRAIWDPREAAV